MERERRDKGRIFLITFLLTLALLSCIMVATVMAVQPNMPQSPGDAPEQQEPSYRPQASDSLTLAVVSDDAKNYLLIRFNPQYGQVPLTILPAESLVTIGGARMTLAQAFQKGGGANVKAGISERFGIQVDRYARISSDAFIRIAEKTGSVVFELPYPIAYTNRKGFSINLAAGERRLDGKDIADIFAYPNFKTQRERSELLGNLTAAVINQNLKAASQDLSSGLFRLAVNLVDTDLSYTDYEYRREAADFVSKLEMQVAGGIAADGTLLPETGTFELSEEFVGLIRQYFEAV